VQDRQQKQEQEQEQGSGSESGGPYPYVCHLKMYEVSQRRKADDQKNCTFVGVRHPRKCMYIGMSLHCKKWHFQKNLNITDKDFGFI